MPPEQWGLRSIQPAHGMRGVHGGPAHGVRAAHLPASACHGRVDGHRHRAQCGGRAAVVHIWDARRGVECGHRVLRLPGGDAARLAGVPGLWGLAQHGGRGELDFAGGRECHCPCSRDAGRRWALQDAGRQRRRLRSRRGVPERRRGGSRPSVGTSGAPRAPNATHDGPPGRGAPGGRGHCIQPGRAVQLADCAQRALSAGGDRRCAGGGCGGAEEHSRNADAWHRHGAGGSH